MVFTDIHNDNIILFVNLISLLILKIRTVLSKLSRIIVFVTNVKNWQVSDKTNLNSNIRLFMLSTNYFYLDGALKSVLIFEKYIFIFKIQ